MVIWTILETSTPMPRTARETAQSAIRLATTGDAEAISAILARAFASYEPLYTARAFEATVISPPKVRERMNEGPVWIAVLDDQPVGTASAVVSTKGCYIRGMAVLPAARGLRIGWGLLDHIERLARNRDSHRLYLSTTPFLDRAISLYRHFGFVRTDEGPFDLSGTPLFTMEKLIGRELRPPRMGVTG